MSSITIILLQSLNLNTSKRVRGWEDLRVLLVKDIFKLLL